MSCISQGRTTNLLSLTPYMDTSLKRFPQPSTWAFTITKDMTWNEHIGKTASKANKKLGFLCQNIKTRDQSLKEKAYKTMVRPTMEYCSTVCDPYKKTHSDTLEKVQRCAARWVMGRFHNMSSPSAMMQDLGWRDLN